MSFFNRCPIVRCLRRSLVNRESCQTTKKYNICRGFIRVYGPPLKVEKNLREQIISCWDVPMDVARKQPRALTIVIRRSHNEEAYPNKMENC